ncbi:MAG: hypothetical protein Q7U16_03885 [Agitococcus sp.]|nr:hypothetical protein [Agitococcus sp.]
MYPDPKRVRHHRIAVNLNDYEFALIEAYSNYTGIDKSSVVRQLAMREAANLLDAQNNQHKDTNEVTNQEL